jgi:hypothetical protein
MALWRRTLVKGASGVSLCGLYVDKPNVFKYFKGSRNSYKDKDCKNCRRAYKWFYNESCVGKLK